MSDAFSRRAVQTRGGRAVSEDVFIRWLLAQQLPRELLMEILRALATDDRETPVAEVHAAHIRTLRRIGRRSDGRRTRTRRWSAPVPSVAAIDADPWSRRVSPVMTVEPEVFTSLLEQVQELHRLADEVTRLREQVDDHSAGRTSDAGSIA
jgi:hypothetical protein